ncbi:hypothetical protein VF21_00314 [Pseudogymnoascus sp. 05NY08]|nr:hypothetical protein VF21_00314 [Pseudogymnoascus sp. 05NY08]
MADTSRMSGFLPTIKCSMCAQEIEISMMGEHVCGPAEPTPPLEPSKGYSTYSPYDSKPLPPPDNSGAYKSTRLPPPRVDTRAANRPFTRPDQLTPVSASSESRSASPMTPSDGLRSPYPRALSAARTQINDRSSPDFLATNSDSSFPPFPPPKSPYLARPQQYAEADPRYAPVSPRLGQGGVLKRMNTIAPGPFDIKGRRGQREGAEEGGDEEPNHMRSKSTDRRAHGRSTSSGSSMSPRSPPRSDIPPIPIRTERPGGYGGFGPPRSSSSLDAPPPLTPANRSNTFPKAAPGGSNFVGLPRRPSESARPRHPSTSTVASTTFDGPTFVRTSPPRDPHARQPSITPPPPPRGPALARKDSAAGINLDAEFGAQNPFHTPSVSQSSSDSSHSPRSKTSSRSSPPSSVEPPRRRQEKSAMGGFDGLMQDLEQAIAEVPVPQPQPQQPAVQDARGRRNLDPSLLSPEFADPAIQSGLRSPGLPRDTSSDSRYDPQQGHSPRRPSAPRLEQPNASLRRPSQPHSPSFQPARRPSTAASDTMNPHTGPPARRPSTAKGACKACQLPITGKSLSSSDGRLTGHYHKACFACTTCRAPFATASFYVLDDAPYCARDYHRLNGSCCGGCGGGIEGACLETARGGGMGGRKFHPGCLVCSDCRGPVSDGYFEIAGRVYCERDAMRRAQMRARGRGGRGRGGPGGMLGVGGGMGRMERRTTRLMMI